MKPVTWQRWAVVAMGAIGMGLMVSPKQWNRTLASEGSRHEFWITVNQNQKTRVFKAQVKRLDENSPSWLVTLEDQDCQQCGEQLILNDPQIQHITDIQKAVAKSLSQKDTQTIKSNPSQPSGKVCPMAWDEGLVSCLTDNILNISQSCEKSSKSHCRAQLQDNWRRLKTALLKALGQTEDETLHYESRESIQRLLRDLPSQGDFIRNEILVLTRMALIQRTLKQYQDGISQGLLPQMSAILAKQSLAQELNWFYSESFTRIIWDSWQEYVWFENPSQLNRFHLSFENQFYQPLTQFWLKDPQQWLLGPIETVNPPTGPTTPQPSPIIVPPHLPGQTPNHPPMPELRQDTTPVTPSLPAQPQPGPIDPTLNMNQPPTSQLPPGLNVNPQSGSTPPSDLPARRRQGQRTSNQ